jgi:hypothetical protein
MQSNESVENVCHTLKLAKRLLSVTNGQACVLANVPGKKVKLF